LPGDVGKAITHSPSGKLITSIYKAGILKFTLCPLGQIGFGLTPSPGKPKNKNSL
jgi:hypothetical protein